MSRLIPVQYDNSSAPHAHGAWENFSPIGNAEPTSRVLVGSMDHGYAEEWAEPGNLTIDGEAVSVFAMYLFDASEITEEAENYPWDADHVRRFIVRD